MIPIKTKRYCAALLIIIGAFATPLSNAGPTIVGSEQIIFSAPMNDRYPGGHTVGNIVNGPNYTYEDRPYFDGPITPISFPSGGSNKVRFNASIGWRNYELTADLSGSGDAATFGTLQLNYAPVYTSTLDSNNNTFAWREWLYGTFRDAASNKVYSVIYNEYYGGYFDATPKTSWYSALGLAVSSNNGSTFQHLGVPPSHVIAEANYLYPTEPGYGLFGGIFKSPLDNLYYAGLYTTDSAGHTIIGLMRTNNLNVPTSWRAWDGTSNSSGALNFTLATTPFAQPPASIGVNFFYIGYSDYFKKYFGLKEFSDAAGKDEIVYYLSDDLAHWGPRRFLIYNPVCGPTHDCGENNTAFYAYPSVMDPKYLTQSGDSTQASNGIIGHQPLVTYIKNFTTGTYRQQLAIQKVNFDSVPVNLIDNISVRGIVGTGNKNLLMGIIVQGTEPKQIVFRAMGPSINFGANFGYPTIPNPRITLINSTTGEMITSNLGWQTLPTAQQNILTSHGLQPGSSMESAIVYTLSSGYYVVSMDNGTGAGLLELYDLSPLAEGSIGNVSVRGYSQPGNGNLIMGFFSRGQTAVIRGTGISTLQPYGFTPVIPNPAIAVHQGSTVIRTNDNWGTDPDHLTIQSEGLAPGNAYESATMVTTQRSSYTAVLSGTGFGLLELYQISN